MTRLDAHNYKKRMDFFFEKLKSNDTMPEIDKATLKRYADYLVSEGITYGRVGKYLSDLKRVSAVLGKPFAEANEEDIRRVVTALERNDDYSAWSKRDFKVATRKFYTWLRGSKAYPPEVAWMKVYGKIRNEKTHEDMLTEEEVKRLIEHAPGVQLRAFIATLYESGCRIGELIYLKMGQVKFDDYGAQLYVTGKTGFRRVRIVASVPYLAEWTNKHPSKTDAEAHLWLNRKNEPFAYNGIAQMLYRLARKAGIRKSVNPHNFRHSRATYLANFLTEAQMKEFFGWQQDSKMAAVYVHLSGRDVDNALLKVYGIDNGGQKQESTLKPKNCSRCNETNQVTNKFCQKCGMPLDQKAISEILQRDKERLEADEVLDSLLQDEEFREMLIRKVLQRNGSLNRAR